MRKRMKQGSAIPLVALLALLAVPAVSWAMPQRPVSEPPGMAPPGMARGGGGGVVTSAPAPAASAIAAPAATDPYGPPLERETSPVDPFQPAARFGAGLVQPGYAEPAPVPAGRTGLEPEGKPAVGVAPVTNPVVQAPAPVAQAPAAKPAVKAVAKPTAPGTRTATTTARAAAIEVPAALRVPAPQAAEAPAPLRVPAAAAPEPPSAVSTTAATPAVAPTGVSVLMEDATSAAATLHATIAVQDWALARTQAVTVRDQLARLAEPDLRSPGLRDRIVRLQKLGPAIDLAITRRDAFRANDAAYRTVYGLLDAITFQAAASRPAGGGGGMSAPAPLTPAAAPDVPPAVAELRAGYPAAMKAHAALLRGEPEAAKAQLDAVREHLQTALKLQPGAVFGRRLDDLNKRRWRVIAALANPTRSQRMSVQLTRAYAEAVHAVGQVASAGTVAAPGGGGGTARSTITPARLRAIQRPNRERTRGDVAMPYDKRHR